VDFEPEGEAVDPPAGMACGDAGQLTRRLETDVLPYIPSGSPIILFSALDNDPSLAEAFTLALTRGYALTVVSPSSIDFEAATGRIPVGPETVARMERENMVTELRGWGVHIGDWKPGEPVNMALAGAQR